MQKVNFLTAPTYRSTFRCKAIQINFEPQDDDDTWVIDTPQGQLIGSNGDYLVQWPDGKIEVMARDLFERQYETDAGRKAKKLELEQLEQPGVPQ